MFHLNCKRTRQRYALITAPESSTVAAERVAMICEAAEYFFRVSEGRCRNSSERRRFAKVASVVLAIVRIVEETDCSVIAIANAASLVTRLGTGGPQQALLQAFVDPTPSEIRYRTRRLGLSHNDGRVAVDLSRTVSCSDMVAA